MTPTRHEPLILSARDIEALAIEDVAVIGAIRRVLMSAPSGQALKTTLSDGNGSYFQALPSILPNDGVACLKWASVLGQQTASPGIQATILLTSLDDGRLLAVLDGQWITAMRTAAMSAIAAQALARPSSAAIGLVGGGRQAQFHLNVLKKQFPTLDTCTVYDVSDQSAERLLGQAARLGLATRKAHSPREAVANQDIVVTTIPASGMSGAFMDAAWLRTGAFATLVDLGRGWTPASLARVPVVATDDRNQSRTLAEERKLNHPGPYGYDLRELATHAPGALSGDAASIFIFSGMGLCDAAAALLCYHEAQRQL